MSIETFFVTVCIVFLMGKIKSNHWVFFLPVLYCTIMTSNRSIIYYLFK